MVEAEKCRSRSSVGQPAQHLIWHAHHTKLHCKMIRMLRNCVSKLSNLKSHLHSIFVEHRRGISIYHGPDAQPKSTDHGSIRSVYLAQLSPPCAISASSIGHGHHCSPTIHFIQLALDSIPASSMPLAVRQSSPAIYGHSAIKVHSTQTDEPWKHWFATAISWVTEFDSNRRLPCLLRWTGPCLDLDVAGPSIL